MTNPSHAFSSHPGHGDAELTAVAAASKNSDPLSYFPGQDDVERDYQTKDESLGND